MIPDLSLPTIGWFTLAGLAATGTAVSALADMGRHGTLGLYGVVLAVTGLLMMLGLDLAALAWLALGFVLVRLPAMTRRVPGGTQPASRHRRSRYARSLRFVAGLPAAVLGVLLARVVWSVDWRDHPPPPPPAGSAEIGGRLLTEDIVLLIGTCFLLVSVLTAAIWISRLSRSAHDRGGS